jgi:hypothetical protein
MAPIRYIGPWWLVIALILGGGLAGLGKDLIDRLSPSR